MRKLFFTLCTLLLAATFTFAQQQKYYRVQVFANEKGLQRLASLGVTVDHGESKKGNWLVSDFSEDELSIIKRNGFQHKILISDVSAYYASRSNNIDETDEATEKAAACATYTKPVNFKTGTMGGFYTYAEMLTTLDKMAAKFPGLITVKQVVSNTLTTSEGRPLYYVKISDNPNTDETEPKILYTALHHAREPESLSQLIFYMWYVLEHYNTDTYIKNIVDSTEMFFIPCLNPDGYIYNQTTNPNGGGLWRKNRRNNGGSFGVDLNRNYGYKWGFDNSGSSNIPSSDTYRGPSAFSEPETQMVRDFCNAHPFYYALNNHTYSNLLIYPWGYKANFYVPAPDSLKFKNDAIRLAQCNGFTTGTANQTVGYVVNGSSDDWMYGEQTTKSKIFALTPETGSSSDGFWPRKNRIIPLSQANMDMNLTAAQFTKESVLAATPASIANNIIATEKQLAITSLSNAPNPCKTYTFISYQVAKTVNNQTLRLDIFDASGVRAQSIKVSAAQTKVLVNTADLKAGIYYYSISDGQNKSAVAKLVVVK